MCMVRQTGDPGMYTARTGVFITSLLLVSPDKEVRFSVALVCLFVCMLAALLKSYKYVFYSICLFVCMFTTLLKGYK